MSVPSVASSPNNDSFLIPPHFVLSNDDLANSSINKTIKAVYYTQVGKPEDFARYYDTLPADSTLPTFPGAKVFIDIACDINKPGARYVQEILFSDGNYEVAKKTFTDMRDPSQIGRAHV